MLVGLSLLSLLLLLLCSGARSRLDEPHAVSQLIGRFPRSRMWTESSLNSDHKDPRLKDSFIRHLTGPLYFSPKCKKHFYRLYHNSRDCTTPNYYRRCARLLTRLAKSPRCIEP